MLKLLLVIDCSRVLCVNCKFPDESACYGKPQSMNEPNPGRILSQDPLSNTVLGNAVEFPTVVCNVVVLRTDNALVLL
jgi:hypothetical protein